MALVGDELNPNTDLRDDREVSARSPDTAAVVDEDERDLVETRLS